MGNRFTCMTKKETKDVGSRSKRMGRSQRKLVAEEDLHLQALSMALQQHQLSQRFEGSMSRRIGSTSSRRRTLSDSFSATKQVALLCCDEVCLCVCARASALSFSISIFPLWVTESECKVLIFEAFDQCQKVACHD